MSDKIIFLFLVSKNLKLFFTILALLHFARQTVAVMSTEYVPALSAANPSISVVTPPNTLLAIWNAGNFLLEHKAVMPPYGFCTTGQ